MEHPLPKKLARGKHYSLLAPAVSDLEEMYLTLRLECLIENDTILMASFRSFKRFLQFQEKGHQKTKKSGCHDNRPNDTHHNDTQPTEK